jgi:hypothetical protein
MQLKLGPWGTTIMRASANRRGGTILGTLSRYPQVDNCVPATTTHNVVRVWTAGGANFPAAQARLSLMTVLCSVVENGLPNVRPHRCSYDPKAGHERHQKTRRAYGGEKVRKVRGRAQFMMNCDSKTTKRAKIGHSGSPPGTATGSYDSGHHKMMREFRQPAPFGATDHKLVPVHGAILSDWVFARFSGRKSGPFLRHLKCLGGGPSFCHPRGNAPWIDGGLVFQY